MIKSEFSCTDCGKCCQIMTKVSLKDVDRISKLGFKDFTMKDPVKNDGLTYLKRNGLDCVFLIWKGDKSFCKIHSSRPKVCRDYPFFGKKSIDVKDCYPESVLKVI